MPSKRQARRKAAAGRPAHGPTAAAATAPSASALTAPAAELTRPSLRDALAAHSAAVVRHRAFPLAALAAIYCVSVAVYAALSHDLLPNLFPDEMFYGKISQGVAFGQGFSWRGSSWELPPLWSLVLSLAWHTGSVPDGYAVAKVMAAMLASATVVPVWLLARTLVSPRLALVPAALCVAGAWMEVTEFVASENLAYPLATASLAATVMAVRDTRARWMVVSVGFAVLAALTRTQLLVLPVILVLALLIDVARQPRGQRRARAERRPKALWIGLVVAVAATVLAFVVKPDLTNYNVLANHASVGKVIATTGRHAVSSIVMFAFIPVAVLAALMARPANWRDERVGPLLVTVAATIVVLYPLLGRFEVNATLGEPVDRYAMYLAPLMLVAVVVAPGRIGRRTVAVAALAVGALLFTVPIATNYLEQPALFGLQKRLFDLAPFVAHHLKLALVLFAVPVTVAGALALTSRRRPEAGLAAAAGLVFAVMVVQSWTSQSLEISTIDKGRATVVPAQLDWVDRHATGPVGLLSVAKPQPVRGNFDLYTEFFSRKIDHLYSTISVETADCGIDFKPGGVLATTQARCLPLPRNWVIVDGPVKTTLRDAQVLATTPHHGILVRTPPGAPRALGVVQPPCWGTTCTGQLRLGLYLQAQARVSVTFGGGAAEHRVQTGKDIRTLPPGQDVTLNFAVPTGDQGVNLPVDWSSPDGAPQLKAVIVRSAGTTSRLW